MKHAIVPALVFVLTAAAYSGLAVDLPAPVVGVDVPEPGAPGPFTAHDVQVPEGWRAWTDDVHKQCGDLKLVFLNPDLQENDAGIIEASGTFFIQFQAVGEDADKITRFSFSFGVSHEAIDNQQVRDIVNCNQNLPDNPLGKGTAGAYLLFYRSDFNADDGFFVPIETRNVPDGQYAAAVHAYTGEFPNYVEVARGWAVATVDNCPSDLSGPNTCPNDSAEAVIGNDKIVPWPIVLPGDGQQTNDVAGLTIEVAEPTLPDKAEAFINGEKVELSEWIPAPRDVDLVPMNDETDCPVTIRSVCEKKIYAPGYKWEGPVNIGDIIRVNLEDLNGNRVTKQIHYGFTSGGAASLDVPEIDYETLTPDSEVVNAGDTHRFKMRLKNIGGGDDAHVNLFVDYNKSHVQAKWENVEQKHQHENAEGEVHVVIGPGEQTVLDVVVKTSSDTPKGVYKVAASLEYPAAGENVVKSRDLFLTVESAIEANDTANVSLTETPVVEDSPGPGLVAALLMVGALVAVVRLRRRA